MRNGMLLYGPVLHCLEGILPSKLTANESFVVHDLLFLAFSNKQVVSQLTPFYYLRRTATLVDWFLEFLCRESVASLEPQTSPALWIRQQPLAAKTRYVLGTKSQALAFRDFFSWFQAYIVTIVGLEYWMLKGPFGYWMKLEGVEKWSSVMEALQLFESLGAVKSIMPLLAQRPWTTKAKDGVL